MVATGRTGWKNPRYKPRNKVEAALQKKFGVKKPTSKGEAGSQKKFGFRAKSGSSSTGGGGGSSAVTKTAKVTPLPRATGGSRGSINVAASGGKPGALAKPQTFKQALGRTARNLANAGARRAGQDLRTSLEFGKAKAKQAGKAAKAKFDKEAPKVKKAAGKRASKDIETTKKFAAKQGKKALKKAKGFGSELQTKFKRKKKKK